MAITESFKKAVLSEDIAGIRIMMKNSLLFEPTFKEFDEMESIAKNVKRLYDEHDDVIFLKDKILWTDNYMDKLMVEVVDNFSCERLKHLKEVVRYLRPIPAHTQETSSKRESTTSNNRHTEKHSDDTNSRPLGYKEQKRQDERDNIVISRNTKIAAGVVAGGVLGVVVAGVAGSTVAVGAVVGAVAAGVAVAVVTNGEQ